MKSLYLSFMLSPLFAAAGTGSAAPKANANTPAPTTGAPVATAKAEPVIIGVSSAVALPARSSRRGNKGVYDLTKLTAVGMSLAIKGRKKENLTSTISSANRDERFATFKTDEAGLPVFGVKEIKDAAGNVVNRVQGDKIVLSRRVFFAHDCDPKTDPDGADVRIFRDADKVLAS